MLKPQHHRNIILSSSSSSIFRARINNDENAFSCSYTRRRYRFDAFSADAICIIMQACPASLAQIFEEKVAASEIWRTKSSAGVTSASASADNRATVVFARRAMRSGIRRMLRAAVTRTGPAPARALTLTFDSNFETGVI